MMYVTSEDAPSGPPSNASFRQVTARPGACTELVREARRLGTAAYNGLENLRIYVSPAVLRCFRPE